jgi:hypothetical protein
MPNPDFNELFHDSGVQGILDFLLSKLEVNDLSPDEALAMLSAVHGELDEGVTKDPKTFKSYKDFMVFLQRERPEIYNHVVSAWNRGNEKAPAEDPISDTNFEDPRINSTSMPNIEGTGGKGIDGVKELIGVPNEESEPLEPGEIEEKASTEVEKIDEHLEEPNQKETQEEQEEPDEEGNEQKENKAEESEELTNYDSEEPEVNSKPLENEDEGTEEINVEIESGEKETASAEESEINNVSDELIENTERNELEGDPEVKADDAEWPVIEEPAHGEPLDDLEEEEGPPGAED